MENDSDGDLDTAADGDMALSDSDSELSSEIEGEIEFEDGDWDNTIESDIDFEHIPCTYDPSSTVPKIYTTPNEADFGSVQIGDTSVQEIELCNSGGVDLHISSMQFSQGTSHEFYKEHESLPITLTPGTATILRLHYMPEDDTVDSGDMQVLSDDPEDPRVDVPLISAIKSAPRVVIEPEIIQFRAVIAGQANYRTVEVVNIGTVETEIAGIETLLGTGYYEIDNIETGSASVTVPYSLDSGESSEVTIKLNMPPEEEVPEGGIPDDQMQVTWYLDGAQKQTTAVLTTSSVAHCGVPVARPDQQVVPLDTVYLDGSASTDDNGAIVAYKWDWYRVDGEAQKPEGSYRAVIKDNRGDNIQGIWTDEVRPNFYAELAGTYVVSLSLCDSDDGYTSPEDCGTDAENQVCTDSVVDLVTIEAIPQETIHVQLIWSKEGNDHDLHMVRPNGTYVRADKESRDDCHWLNCDTQCSLNEPPCACAPQGCPGPAEAPDWSTQGVRDDDPTLDIDDIDGRGPENINLSLPQAGKHLVAVENYAGKDSQSITVRIWIFGTLRKTFRYGPPYTESYLKYCNHWNVAWLDVKSPTRIDVVEINTIEKSDCSKEEEPTPKQAIKAD